VRRTCFAILEDECGRVLLQKRPPAGIWGGLWSFPECPPEADVETWIKQAFGSRVSHLRREPGLRHSFTHFHLDITPVRARLRQAPDEVREQAGICWVEPGEELALGMAAPVKKLIESL
jgi:A/G-specific adenine glycosylase